MASIEWLSPLLPVTVIAAVVLFVIKESIEVSRRVAGNRRKIKAFKIILARECELNNWAYRCLKSELNHVQDVQTNDYGLTLAVEHRSLDQIMLITRYADGSAHGYSPIWPVHAGVMKQLMLEVATINKALFDSIEKAYDSALEVEHVRQSLIRFLENDDEEDKLHFTAFPQYGLRELEKASDNLQALYRTCTDQELTKFRLR
jgi:hypothetical protein